MATLSKRLLLFASFTVFTLISVVNAQSIKGKVLDATTGEPLVGAVVKLENTKFRTIVKLDGSYTFAKLPLGYYTIKVSYEGFSDVDLQTVTLTDNSTKTVGFNLKPLANELSSVTVSTTSAKNGEVGARRLEKISDPIINVLSEKTLQLLPDITVANALQRVSGVSIERSGSGEGRYPIIRGMEKRYINTLVNGIKIPSPDNKNRFIPLDLFPSELLERLEVSKSLTPSMEGDAIGGTVNLVMKDAPEKRLLSVNVSTGYSDIFMHQGYQHFDHTVINKQSPNEIKGGAYVAVPSDFSVSSLNYTNKKAPINTTLGLTCGNRFGAKKQFGLILSGSYQNIYKGTNSTFLLLNAQPNYNNVASFAYDKERRYSTQTQRVGVTGKFDFRINNKNTISLFNTYIRLDDYQVRLSNEKQLGTNNVEDFLNRSIWQYQSIYNSTLQGIHKLTSSIKLDWSLVYSIANNHAPDEAEFDHQQQVDFITGIRSGYDKVQSISHKWSHNSDKDYSTYVNVTKQTKLLGKSLELKAGALGRAKTRNNFYNSYSLTPLLIGGINQTYSTINNAVFTFKGAGASTPDSSGNDYTFEEYIGAGYLQGKLQLTPKLEALGGVRVEYTHQHYVTAQNNTVPSAYGKIWYTDFLPSLQFKYVLDNTKSFRLAYYRALTRPGFAEMIPDGPQGEYFPERGNPDSLNHTVADNLDFRYEYFSGKADQLLAGIFYKNIQDPIEYSTIQNKNSLYLEPNNWGNATNYGLEVQYTKYIGVFGVSANYTYTQSKITTNKIYKAHAASGIGSDFHYNYKETRPLQGQSNHIGNISLLYKNPSIGLDIQAAMVYTGERIALVSPYYGLSYWQAPTTQLDLSFEKKLIKRITVYGKINNLTNAAYQLELHQSYNDYLKSVGSGVLPIQTDAAKKIIVQKDYYKTTYLLGFRYKF